MLSRRALLATATLWPLPAMVTGAHAVETLRVGVLPFGTVGWEAAVIKERKLDEAQGFTLQTMKLAGNDAARIAFQGAQVDAIVGDLIWAARVDSEGRKLRFAPFSATEGALMVPENSAISGIAGLAGKRLGIAGGALDKSWILLKSQAREAANLDLEAKANVAYGAPPLLTQKLESGELDAALLYWQFCARLEAKGFRRLISADDIMRAFGAKGSVSLLGYLFDETTVQNKGETVRAFLRASAAAKDLLANEADAWNIVRPLMAVDDEATFERLKRSFLDGIPRRPLAAERADAQHIYETIARLGGEQLVGKASTLPKDFYLDGNGNG